ncbi:hypothetical protein NFJ02_32g82390 [Pycnococcus provasolii]
MAAVAQEPPEIVALRLQLQIAEAQRDQAVAEAQGRAVAPVGQQPVQLNYLLPRDFEEVVSADLFPRDGVGRQGAVNPLRLDNDLAITEYSRRKSKHQVWTYRRSRTAGAYLELGAGDACTGQRVAVAASSSRPLSLHVRPPSLR